MSTPLADHPNAVAIVGMACRFPGASTPAQFWNNLAAGVESIRRFSREELLAAGLPPGLIDHPDFVSAHGALDDIAGFDADLFGITAAEAALIDPQHRLLLECAHAALEDAGIDPSRITPGSDLTGVFAGCGLPAYLLRQVYPALDADDPGAVYQAMLGNDKDFLAARIAYKLNLGGPALTLQAACATALVCVHTACQSLLNGECDTALAGGVSLRIPQAGGALHQAGGIHSADGHCRAFDADADGTVSGSGAGMVVLKRLGDALAAGLPVHAVIRGSAVNNDGARKMSFTAPGVDGQAAAIAEALAVAGVEPGSIGYVEAHGTGTALGDPIEIAALAQAFGPLHDGAQPCLIGSVKTNIGHLDAAAGIAGLIKAVLALRHGAVPPSLHFRQANPNISFAHGRFRVSTALTPWPDTGGPRRAGVSSFGLGGHNAHVVLEQAPAVEPRPATPAWRLYPLSARAAQGRQALADDLAAHLEAHPDTDAADLAWTLCTGRQTLAEAGFAVARSTADLARALRERPLRTATRAGQPPRIAFLYPGQGAQQAGAGRQLYDDEPAFRAALDACAEALRAAGASDVRDFLLAASTPQLENRLRETVHAQTVLFALSHALTALWRQRGITPGAVLGHSCGEYAAAVAAGLLDLADAARALAARARLMADMPPGGMSAIGLAEAELAALLPEGLAIAAVNGPAQCTVAGDLDRLAAFEQQLAARGLAPRRLHVAHAFHTAAADGVLPRFREALRGLPLQAPHTRFYSAVLGRRADAGELCREELWVDQIRQPVRFAPALQALLADGCTAVLEVGPGGTLAALAQLAPHAPACVVPGLNRGGDPARDLLDGLGELWLAGAQPDWSALLDGGARRRLSLPTAPLLRTRHWMDAASQGAPFTPAQPPADPIRLLVPGWQRAAPLPPVPDAALAARWLVVADAGNALVDPLVARLRLAGSVTLVSPGTWRTPAEADAGYHALLAQEQPQRILHAWWPVEAEQHAVPQALGNLLRLLRAAAAECRDLRDITVLSQGALEVTGSEPLDPRQATLIGPVRAVPLEFPDVGCRLLDVLAHDDPERLAQAIAAELAAPAPQPLAALRGGHRWLFDMLPAQPVPQDAPPPIRPGGIYLITGGLGGLGLAVADALAAQAPVRLALLGRTPLPPQAEWADWLQTRPQDDPAARSITGILALQARGAEVLVLHADTADQAQTDAALSALRQRWGAPDGVIHAAGVAGGGAMAGRGDDAVAAVLRPKTTGAQALLAALGDARPGFVLLFSSINTWLPVPGQADYAAANAYLETLAAQLRQRGIRATAIAWDAWRSVGMAAWTPLPEPLRAARAQELAAHGLATADACRALIDILRAGWGQVAVASAARLQAILQTPMQAAAAPAPPPPEPEAQATTVIDGLAEIWKTLLGIAQPAPEDDFFQRGGHSLLATRVGFRVRQRWGCALSLNDIFAHSTLAAMAALIEARSQAQAGRETLVL